MSIRLVVDASVAGGAGDDEATHQNSVACRDVLRAISSQTLRVVMCPTLRGEWKRHQSGFARKWLYQMHSRRLVVLIVEDPPDHPQILKKLAFIGEAGRNAIAKDMHLINCAFVTDKRIISCDETVRSLLSDLSRRATVIRKIQWVNPLNNSSVDWVRNGAAVTESNLLVAP